MYEKVVRLDASMERAIPMEYTAALCHMKDGEAAPFEMKEIIASTDDEAVRKATEWTVSVIDMIDKGTWLVLKQGAKSVHSKRLS